MSILLRGEDLSKRFRRPKEPDGWTDALMNVSFSLNQGEALGIVGESGCGKSTLLRVISGMLQPDSGNLFYRDQHYTGQGPGQTGKFLQMIFQDAAASFDPLRTMKQSILESGRGRRDEAELTELIRSFGLEEELLQRRPSELSGGQCQRMSIARAFYSHAQILLCDEITSALDVSSQAQVIRLLQDLKENGRLSAIFVSHDIALVSMLCDRVMVMKSGQVVEEGETHRVITAPEHSYTKQLIMSAQEQSLQASGGEERTCLKK